MKLKFIAAGVLAAASFSASATDHQLGILDPTGSDTLSGFSEKFVVSGTAIKDSWFFQLLTPSAASFGAQQTFAAPVNAISNFSGTLFSADGTVKYGSLTSLIGAKDQSLSWGSALGTGSYRVDITGLTSAPRTQYTATVSALPVPEPETYGMLLGGLALVGAVARRRAKKAA